MSESDEIREKHTENYNVQYLIANNYYYYALATVISIASIMYYIRNNRQQIIQQCMSPNIKGL